MRNTFSRPGSASCISVTYRKEPSHDDNATTIELVDVEVTLEEEGNEEEEL